MRSQKPANRAAAGGMHKGQDAAVYDHTIKTGVAELDRIAMVMLEAVHGGPRWKGKGACPGEVHFIRAPGLRKRTVTRTQNPSRNSKFATEKFGPGDTKGRSPLPGHRSFSH